MANTKTISNEQIIAALMHGGGVTAAAKLLDISPRTIYNRMREKEFKIEYSEAKADILRAALSSLQDRTEKAVETICDLMQDEENPAAVRLQAAQAILNQAGKFSDRLTASEFAIEERTKWGIDDFFKL